MILANRSYSVFILSMVWGVILLISGCSTSEQFTGYSYDPEGVTNTTDKEIQLQHKRTIGIIKDGVWVSNEFNGARMNDFYKVSDSQYRNVIDTERLPIKYNPWLTIQ